MATIDIITLPRITGMQEGRLRNTGDILLRVVIRRTATTPLQPPMGPRDIQLRLATFTVTHPQDRILAPPAVDIRQVRHPRAITHSHPPETMWWVQVPSDSVGEGHLTAERATLRIQCQFLQLSLTLILPLQAELAVIMAAMAAPAVQLGLWIFLQSPLLLSGPQFSATAAVHMAVQE